jgi:cytochrome c oxidase subunit II
VQKLWALLFGVVLSACFVATALALAVPDLKWGLPTNIAAVYGAPVDSLFYLILAFVGFFYVLTEVILVVAMFRSASEPGKKAVYTHGNHRLELAWTIIPAAILLYIAYAQITTWEDIKYQSHFPKPDQVVQVTARQWEWRLRYRGEMADDGKTWRHNWSHLDAIKSVEREKAWGESPEFDDVHVVNDLHTWKGAKVKILLKSNDIIHSFFLPNLRLKQDALPGKTIPMWFQVIDDPNTPYDNYHFDPKDPTKMEITKGREWEIACAELCGGGHYRMRGRLIVHDTKENYEAWLKYTKEQEGSRSLPETKATE